jgi:hypothetical protein
LREAFGVAPLLVKDAGKVTEASFWKLRKAAREKGFCDEFIKREFAPRASLAGVLAQSEVYLELAVSAQILTKKLKETGAHFHAQAHISTQPP